MKKPIKKLVKKLALRGTTIRALLESELAPAAGGGEPCARTLQASSCQGCLVL